jgi:hypothetical protein
MVNQIKRIVTAPIVDSSGLLAASPHVEALSGASYDGGVGAFSPLSWHYARKSSFDKH